MKELIQHETLEQAMIENKTLNFPTDDKIVLLMEHLFINKNIVDAHYYEYLLGQMKSTDSVIDFLDGNLKKGQFQCCFFVGNCLSEEDLSKILNKTDSCDQETVDRLINKISKIEKREIRDRILNGFIMHLSNKKFKPDIIPSITSKIDYLDHTSWIKMIKYVYEQEPTVRQNLFENEVFQKQDLLELLFYGNFLKPIEKEGYLNSLNKYSWMKEKKENYEINSDENMEFSSMRKQVFKNYLNKLKQSLKSDSIELNLISKIDLCFYQIATAIKFPTEQLIDRIDSIVDTIFKSVDCVLPHQSVVHLMQSYAHAYARKQGNFNEKNLSINIGVPSKERMDQAGYYILSATGENIIILNNNTFSRKLEPKNQIFDVLSHEYRHYYQQNNVVKKETPTIEELTMILETLLIEKHPDFILNNYDQLQIEKDAKRWGMSNHDLIVQKYKKNEVRHRLVCKILKSTKESSVETYQIGKQKLSIFDAADLYLEPNFIKSCCKNYPSLTKIYDEQGNRKDLYTLIEKMMVLEKQTTISIDKSQEINQLKELRLYKNVIDQRLNLTDSYRDLSNLKKEWEQVNRGSRQSDEVQIYAKMLVNQSKLKNESMFKIKKKE